MDKEFLEERLKKLNWTPYRLAKEICAFKATDGKVPPVTQYQSAVNKAVSEPKKSKLETIEELIKALGGTLTVEWNDEPEVAKIKLRNDIAVILQEQALHDNTTLEELVNLLLRQGLFDVKKGEAYIPAASLKVLLQSLIPDVVQEAANSTIGMQLNELTKLIQQLNQHLNEPNKLQSLPSKENKGELTYEANVQLSSSFPIFSSFNSTDQKSSYLNKLEHLEKSYLRDTDEHPYVQELIPNHKESRRNIARVLDSGDDRKDIVNPELENVRDTLVNIKKDAQDFFNRGIECFENQNYKGSLENVELAVSIDPEFAPAYRHAGFIYLVYLRDYQKAVDNLSKSIELNYKLGESYFYRGYAYFNLKCFSEAINDFSEAIRLKDEIEKLTYLSYLHRGISFLEISEYEKASNDFYDFINRNPDDAIGYYFKAYVYYKLKDFPKAIDFYSEAIHREENNDFFYISRGKAYFLLKNSQEAIKDFSRAILINSQSKTAYYCRGIAYAESGEFEKAIEDLSHNIALDPDDYGAYLNRGRAYLESSRIQEAIDDFSEALRLKPDDEWLCMIRGEAFFRQENYQEAIEDLSKAIHLNPKSDFAPHAYNLLGISHDELGNFLEALKNFSQFIDIDSAGGSSYHNRGLLFLRTKIFQSAVEDFTEAIKINPQEEKFYIFRGVAYSHLEKFKEAVNDFSQAIRLNDEDVECYVHRGVTYLNLKSFDKAIKDFSKAIRLSPEANYQLYIFRAFAYIEREQFKKAIQDCSKAIQINPEVDEAYFRRGLALYRLENYEEAIVNFTKAIQLNPNSAQAYHHRSLVYKKLGNLTKAFEDMEKASSINLKPEEMEF